MKRIVKQEISSFSDFKAMDFFIMAMIFMVVGIVPLVVYYAKVAIGPEEMANIKNLEYVVDLFSYCKKNLFLLSVGLLTTAYLLEFITKRQKFDYKKPLRNPITIAAIVYVAAAVLSSFFSKYPHAAVSGVSERYEGVFVLLGYIIIMFTVFSFTKSKFQSRLVLYGIAFSAVIIGIIGAFQFLGINPFYNPIIKFLVLGGRGGNYKSEFTQVYSTLYNPNCVGLYAALMLPVTLTTAVFYDKKKVFKYVLFFVSFLLLICAVGSRSTGGLMGLFADCVVVLVVITVTCIKSKKFIPVKYIIPSAVVLIILIACVAAVPSLRNNLSEMINKIVHSSEIKNEAFYKDLVFDGNTVEIYSEYGKVSIMFDSSTSSLPVLDKNDERVPVINMEKGEDTVTAYYSLEDFGDFRIQSQNNWFAFTRGDSAFLFVVNEDGTIYPLTNMLKPVDPTEEISSIGFENMERWGSGRGYIWSRTFPLLSSNIILGKGSDSYVFQFPQQDVAGKTRTFGNPYMIVDKPHNLYLQIFMNTGLISLLAILFIFGYYIVTTFRSILSSNDEDRYSFGLRLGILTGVCGYLTSSLATDSVISVTPVFWAVLGMGFALNVMHKSMSARWKE